MVVCSTGASQRTVLALFLFTLYTADFTHNSANCHLKKFSDDSTIMCLITDEDDRQYRKLTKGSVDCCQQNHHQINPRKSKELVMDLRRCKHSPSTLMNFLDKQH